MLGVLTDAYNPLVCPIHVVRPLAWNIVNDSNKSDLCFTQPPYLIA